MVSQSCPIALLLVDHFGPIRDTIKSSVVKPMKLKLTIFPCWRWFSGPPPCKIGGRSPLIVHTRIQFSSIFREIKQNIYDYTMISVLGPCDARNWPSRGSALEFRLARRGAGKNWKPAQRIHRIKSHSEISLVHTWYLYSMIIQK